jgi:hypothetical protein
MKLPEPLRTYIPLTKFRSPQIFYLFTAGVEVVYFHLITLRHTPQLVGLLWTRDGPHRRDLYLTTQTPYKRQTSMPSVGFEPKILASAWPQTYPLDRAPLESALDKVTVLKVEKSVISDGIFRSLCGIFMICCWRFILLVFAAQLVLLDTDEGSYTPLQRVCIYHII